MATISGFNFTPNPGTANASLSMVGTLSGLTSSAYRYTIFPSPAGFNITPSSSGLFATGGSTSFDLSTLNVTGSSSSAFTYSVTFNLLNLDFSPVPLNPAGANIITVTINPIPCFKEGANILSYNSDLEKEEYIPVETIRPGSLIKTLKHGYLKVEIIGKSQIYNSGDEVRNKDRLYRCTKDKYPELTEDLIITGRHSILVDCLTKEQEEKTIELDGSIVETDEKPHLIIYLDEKAIPYEEEGTFTIYHLALENENYTGNYGIYANGLLVESCSKHNLKELGYMELIE